MKRTVSGVLDYREQFKDEPLVWSLGALSAGFALGYTVGYAHKNSKGGKKSQIAAFADSMGDELSTVGQSFIMQALNVKIRELFGVNFSDVLDDINSKKRGFAVSPRPKRNRAKSRPKSFMARNGVDITPHDSSR